MGRRVRRTGPRAARLTSSPPNSAPSRPPARGAAASRLKSTDWLSDSDSMENMTTDTDNTNPWPLAHVVDSLRWLDASAEAMARGYVDTSRRAMRRAYGIGYARQAVADMLDVFSFVAVLADVEPSSTPEHGVAANLDRIAEHAARLQRMALDLLAVLAEVEQ